MADREATIKLLGQVGFRDVGAEKIDCPLVIGEGADDAQAVDEAMKVLADAGPAAALMREAEPDPRDAALTLLRERLVERAQDGRVLMEGACWLYSGRV